MSAVPTITEPNSSESVLSLPGVIGRLVCRANSPAKNQRGDCQSEATQQHGDGGGPIVEERIARESPKGLTGPARVIQGSEEFEHMRPGDILVAKITTPAWTPLFALASGVVTDLGGPLSHSSIVAREYHIPAVLGTGVATERLRSGQRIAVDGDAGTVTVFI